MRLIRLLKQDLAKEVEDWVNDDVISQDQASQILSRYGIKPGKPFNLGYTLLIGLGFLFVGLSIITLLGANWDDIPRLPRMLGLVALTAGTQLIACRYIDQGDPTRGIAFFFLGNLFFGASIILIAQIYHLGEHMPDGIYWWALGCMPTAVLLRSRLLALQMLLLASIWFFVEADLGFYPAAYILFLTAAIYVLIRSEGSTILLLTVFAGLGLWIEYSLSAYWQTGSTLHWEAEHIIVTFSLFAATYGFSQWLSNRKESIFSDYGAILAVWCLRFILIALLILSFEGAWEGLIEADWNHVMSMSLLSGLLWVIAIYFAFVTHHYKSLCAFFVLFVTTSVLVIGAEQTAHALAFQIAYNFVIVGLGIWLIIRGITDNISHYFWLGVIAILAAAILRYVDLIGDYIGGAILFMFIAGILLGAARYWKLHQDGQPQ